ncbi:glycosyltransferase family 2 protein [Desulfonatronum thioautotrophicum]|uniref:glycosyltransferase family 2 protein n=1 Tax=Desulfonatronum thioautotrophicum TaxID=617001 RepID=UPI0013792A25|nr:glycosyltransferase [Desulfonatronum thioautotrophicum]
MGKRDSYLNLAEYYRKQGKLDKYEHYLQLATLDSEAVPLKQGRGKAESQSDASLSLSDQELISFYAHGKYDAVLKLFEQNFDLELLPYLASAIHFSQGNPAQASQAAEGIKDQEQRRLRQKTAEMWESLHIPLAHEPRVHLIILCHNREKHVERALRQLASTNYGNYAVYLADNGSADKTWEVAQRAVNYFPAHVPIAMERFPTNIGRPAGHNWLLTKYDHSGADYIAIGDDDLVEVPSDWLNRMIQTAKVFPKCAVVGGKALNPGKPDVIHGGVRNILEFTSDKLEMSNNDDVIDFGQFDYVDKVDHVIGCLHIYDRKVLDEVGLFDIRFSPCQFVDIDHHLRIRMAGHDIIFNGLIAFKHLRGMGKKSQKNDSLAGNAFGNIHKLLHKHDANMVNDALQSNAKKRLAWLLD